MTPVTVPELIRITSDVTGVPVSTITSPTRTDASFRPRVIISRVGRNVLRKSYPKIGRALKRDHTTIVHAAGRFDELHAEDDEFAIQYAEVIKRVQDRVHAKTMQVSEYIDRSALV